MRPEHDDRQLSLPLDESVLPSPSPVEEVHDKPSRAEPEPPFCLYGQIPRVWRKPDARRAAMVLCGCEECRERIKMTTRADRFHQVKRGHGR